MKLKIAEEQNTVELALRINDEGVITVEGASKAWSLVGFRVVDGKINLVRYTSIMDDNYNTNVDGQIKEVDE